MTDEESLQAEEATREPDAMEQQFPGVLSLDERDNFEGYLVPPDKLVEFATQLRDELGYNYLSSVTGVDYLPDEQMEVVYHAYRTEGGPAFVF